MAHVLAPMLPSGARRRAHLLVLTVLAAVIAGMFAAVPVTPAVSATDPCGAGGNAIACENSKPGSPPSEWEITDAGDQSIQGFATDISVNAGQKVDFKIDTNASAYTVTIYRLGYYGGNGARKIATVNPSAALPQAQPQCITDASTELYDCGNWGVSASWNVPATAVSGVYIARLSRADRNDASHITFVVRNDSSHSDVVFQTADPTWQAYNTYGGSDFYLGGGNGRAYKVSYNRPVLTRGGIGGRDFFFSNEYPAVRFMEKNGYDVSYIAGVDSDRFGSLLLNHKTYMSVGHDEYWSKAQRANVTAARDAGVNLMFLSGNEIYWKTRYEPSADASHTSYRTLVCYKETWASAKIDPSTEWTGTWRDPRFAPKSAGANSPENGLTGTIYMSNFTDLPVTVTAAQGKTRLWRNTTLRQHERGHDHRPGSAHGRIRVGRGSRQRLPPAGPRAALDHDRGVARVPSGLREHDRGRHDHAPRDALPGCQRSAGVRGRHRAVDLGPGLHPRQPLCPGACGQADAAGTGEPVRRHGRPADDPGQHSGGRDQVHRHRRAHRDHHVADGRLDSGQRQQRHRDRHGHRPRWRRCRRRRGLHGRRYELAPGRRHLVVVLQLHPARRRQRPGTGARSR